MSISNKWPAAREKYINSHSERELGCISFLNVEYQTRTIIVGDNSVKDPMLYEIEFATDIAVCNMIGQDGIYESTTKEIVYKEDGTSTEISITTPPVRYAALHMALFKLSQIIAYYKRDDKYDSITIHCPRFGCSLAGGVWDKVEPLIHEELSDRGIQVVVYDLP
jgi:hypothetical protein